MFLDRGCKPAVEKMSRCLLVARVFVPKTVTQVGFTRRTTEAQHRVSRRIPWSTAHKINHNSACSLPYPETSGSCSLLFLTRVFVPTQGATENFTENYILNSSQYFLLNTVFDRCRAHWNCSNEFRSSFPEKSRIPIFLSPAQSRNLGIPTKQL
jgi:hypothetical protein